MEFIKIEKEDRVLIISLARGKANPINEAMVEELLQTIGDAEMDERVSAIVLASDRPKFFSPGFDATEVFQYDRPNMTRFFGRFIELTELIYHLRKPVVGAISGHAYAGGAVLALACDERVMAEGDFGFALNEINLGMVVPPGFILMAARASGSHNAWQMVVRGKTFTPADCLQAGLAVEVVKPEAVRSRAIERAAELGAKPPIAFAQVKHRFHETLFQNAPSDREWVEIFMDSWFGAEATEKKNALVQTLRR